MPLTGIAIPTMTLLVEAYFVSSWVDITSVVIAQTIRWQRGFAELGPGDRCASSGACSATLISNPVGTYAPDHQACRAGWGIGTKIRVTLGYDPIIGSSPTPVVVFIGRVREIVPGVGPHRSGRRVTFTATDWLDDAAEMTVQGVVAQVNKRGDEILTAVVAAAAIAPESADYDTGDSTFPYAVDNVQDNQTRLLQVLAQVAQSEHGYVYLTGPGALTFEKRTARQTMTTPAASFDNTMMGFTVRYVRGVRPSKVRVIVHPRIVDAAATTVLFYRYCISRGSPALPITAGATVTVFGPYGDPANAFERCGGTAMVTPITPDDYLANTAADGTGTNKSAQLTVVASFTASGVSFQLTNTDAGTIYVTGLSCRGKGIYNRDPVQVEDGTGTDLVTLDMPLQSDANVAASVAAEVLDLWSDANPCLMTFHTLTDARARAALGVDLGARVWAVETSTGVVRESYVQSIAQSVLPGPVIETTWGLVPASEATYWILESATAGVLGSTTWLGF